MLHHGDFPEIWAEGTSLAEAATHLATKMDQALESAGDSWRRAAIQQAVTDIAEFIDALEHDDAENLMVKKN